MVAVPGSMQTIVVEAGQIDVIGSSSALVLPLADAANHILGQHQMGLLHCQYHDAGVDGTGRFYTYRHPNCVSLFSDFVVENAVEQMAGTTVAFTAGTGATVTVDIGANGRYRTSFDWGAADTGELEVTYTTNDCEILNITIWGVYRTALDVAGGDLGCEPHDPTYLAAGLREGQYIIRSGAGTNIDGLAKAIRDARIYTIRQAASWSAMTGSQSCIPGGGSVNPFAGQNWQHISRKLLSADSTRDYVVYARTYFDGNPAVDTYTWTVTASSGDVATSAALTRVAAGWDQGGDVLAIDCDADDDLTFRFQCATGGVTCHVCDLSIFEHLT